MQVSRRFGAGAAGVLSLLLAASFSGAAQATTPTGAAHASRAAAVAESWPVEDCSDDTYILRTDSITAEPKPLEKGKPLVITAHGTLLEEVREGAQVQVTVKLGLITLLRKTLDLAEELKSHNAPVRVPIEPGKVSLPLFYLDSASDLLKGDFRISVQAYNDDDADLACAKVHMDLRRT
ncbi:ML domain-containing protein [Streptomyces sp. NPDC091292]|uniref:ML domain-containing protein n=1 Tax=Streptomyces sp. NPDC091292 TaxID=3365991 RepID=UPI00381F3696